MIAADADLDITDNLSFGMRQLSRSPRHDDAVADLKRILLRLSTLDGAALVVSTGQGNALLLLRLQRGARVTSPAAIVDAVEAGRFGPAAAKQLLPLGRDPILADGQWLAAAQRDLKVLRQHPGLLRMAAATPRVFRRYGTLDATWLQERQDRLDSLSRRNLKAPSTVNDVIDALHGNGAAARRDRWLARSLDWSRTEREVGSKRVAALISMLHGHSPEQLGGLPNNVLESAVRTVRRLRRLGGRAFDRRINRIVRELVAWPGVVRSRVEGEPRQLPANVAEAVQVSAARLLAAIPSSREAGYVPRLARAVSALAIAYQPDDEPGALSPSDVDLVLTKLDESSAPFARGERARSPTRRPLQPTLTMAQELSLLRLELTGPDVAAAERMLRDGFDEHVIRELHRRGVLRGYEEIAGQSGENAAPVAARAWVRWHLELAPSLEQMGLTLELPAKAFASVARGREGSWTLFAQALLSAPALRTPAACFALIDALLAVSHKAPVKASQLHERLSRDETGIGRRHFPEFAAWLGDEAALDRLCTLQRLAGEELHLPHALLRDYRLIESVLKERSHLATLTSPSRAQAHRLVHLEQRLAGGDAPTSDWTRRRLAERIEAALSRALEAQLDDLLREVLRADLGVAPARLTPAWRDAARFYYCADWRGRVGSNESKQKNRELLLLLLRHAAVRPGVPIETTLPVNRTWLSRQPAGFTAAWLASRRDEVILGRSRYTLAVEQDPVEVLRMGIPFSTCLSLKGSNAASTVLNAMDANKRVLYLRDERGTIVARKLIAVTEERSLVGYRLYLALEQRHQAQVAAAFDRMCRMIAENCGLRLAAVGEPVRLHDGFWYDAGTFPFAEGMDQTSADPVTMREHILDSRVGASELEFDAALRAAGEAGDETEERRLLDLAHYSELDQARALRLVELYGGPKRAPRSRNHQSALIEFAASKGPMPLLRHLASLSVVWESDWEAASLHLRNVSDATGVALAFAKLARRAKSAGRQLGWSGLIVESADLLGYLLARAPVAEGLAALGEIAPVWEPEDGYADADYIANAVEWCASACVEAYARAPDSTAVQRCLSDSSRPLIALQAALRLAARFPFGRKGHVLPSAPWDLTAFEGRPVGCPAAIRALRRLAEARPDLAHHPDLLAALLRQSDPAAPLALGSLPVPTEAPFGAIADLQMHLPELTAAILARWDTDPPSRTNGWELYYHRRNDTTWKRKLKRRGLGDPGRTRSWLAVLGESLSDKDAYIVEEKNENVGGRFHTIAAVSDAVRRQTAGDPVELVNLPLSVTDFTHVRRLLQGLGAAVGNNDHPQMLEAARTLCAIDASMVSPSESARAFWRALTRRLLEADVPGDVLELVAHKWLPLSFADIREMPIDLTVRLAAVPQTRQLVEYCLGLLEPHEWLHYFYGSARVIAELGLEGLGLLRGLAKGFILGWYWNRGVGLPRFGALLHQHLVEAACELGVDEAVGLFLRESDSTRASAMLDHLVRVFPYRDLAAVRPPPEVVRGLRTELKGRRWACLQDAVARAARSE